MTETVDAKPSPEWGVLWGFSMIKYGVGNSLVGSIVDDARFPRPKGMLKGGIVQAIESIVRAIRMDRRDAKGAKWCAIVIFQAALGDTATANRDVRKRSDNIITSHHHESAVLGVN